MPGSCLSAPRSSKVSVKAAEAALAQEGAQAQLDAGGIPQRLAPLAAGRSSGTTS